MLEFGFFAKTELKRLPQEHVEGSLDLSYNPLHELARFNILSKPGSVTIQNSKHYLLIDRRVGEVITEEKALLSLFALCIFPALQSLYDSTNHHRKQHLLKWREATKSNRTIFIPPNQKFTEDYLALLGREPNVNEVELIKVYTSEPITGKRLGMSEKLLKEMSPTLELSLKMAHPTIIIDDLFE